MQSAEVLHSKIFQKLEKRLRFPGRKGNSRLQHD
jgi:hypothetical protein